MLKNSIGIDFGVSRSVVCTYLNGDVRVIPSSEGLNHFENYVAFDDYKVLVGEAAKKRFTTHPEDVVCAIRKDMGKNISKEYMGKMYSPQEISAFIFKKIKDDAEEFIGSDVENAIVAVPAYFDDNQRTAVKDACEIAGLNADIISAPTAAAIAYGIGKDDMKPQRILVFDLGGGSLDITVMECGGGIFEVKATNGDTQLGGTDMDNIVSDYLVKEFEKQHGVKVNLDMNRHLRNDLSEAAKRVRIELSGVYQTEVNLPNMAMDSRGNPLNLVTTINRVQLENLVRPIMNRCIKPLDTALYDAGFRKRDIDKLIFVGSTTRMPIVQQFVQDFLGIDAESGIDPACCVAYGSAIVAGKTESDTADSDNMERLKSQIFELEQIVYHAKKYVFEPDFEDRINEMDLDEITRLISLLKDKMI